MAVVEGRLEGGDDGGALFRSEYRCAGSSPKGVIFGSMSIVIGGRLFDYVFQSTNLVGLEAIKEANRAHVLGEFRDVTVTNLTSLFTVFNGRINILTELTPSDEFAVTSVTIIRPGRVNLHLTGPLVPGIILIGTSAECFIGSD